MLIELAVNINIITEAKKVFLKCFYFKLMRLPNVEPNENCQPKIKRANRRPPKDTRSLKTKIVCGFLSQKPSECCDLYEVNEAEEVNANK